MHVLLTHDLGKENMIWYPEDKAQAEAAVKAAPAVDKVWVEAAASAQEENVFAPIAERSRPTRGGFLASRSNVPNVEPL